MKNFFLALFLTQTLFVFGQKPKVVGPDFDIADFNRKAAVAEWLIRYDTVAWKTTDVMLTQDKADIARLGKEWFCFQDNKNVWHAVYGRFENDKFDLVFHFVLDAAGNIARSEDKPDQDFLTAHARALNTAQKKLIESIPENSPTHNQYIKRNADKTFTVWLLPAFQTNGVAVYGGEFIYTLDQTGAKINKDESYFQGQFRGFETTPPREIWLNYREKEKPTLGAIFFVWYYKSYFTKIYIDNAKSTSTVIKDGANGYIWVHVEKDKKPANPPKQFRINSVSEYFSSAGNFFYS